jgi:K(+)-stimulated pyrophosphate-energized sodium pump
MNISVRATSARRGGPASQGLTIAFRAGAITGLLVAASPCSPSRSSSTCLSGQGHAPNDRIVVEALVALAFGASLISIFARLGGGIFTKAADVGAHVGKVEPESPRTILATRP